MDDSLRCGGGVVVGCSTFVCCGSSAVSSSGIPKVSSYLSVVDHDVVKGGGGGGSVSYKQLSEGYSTSFRGCGALMS